MSRYTMRRNDGLSLAYGFDRPLQYYFATVFDSQGDVIRDVTGRTDIYDLLEEFKISLPEDHLLALTLDLPF